MAGQTLLTLTLLFGLVASGCAPADPGELAGQSRPIGITLDPELPDNEALLVREDLNTLASLSIDGSQVPYFADAFGGNTTTDLVRYISERVHFILPRFTNIERRTVFPSNSAPHGVVRIPDDPAIVAINYGAALSLEELIYRPAQLGFRLGGVVYPVSTSRFGVIGLGPGYTDPRTPDLMRLATWVHEARHSDCTGGISSMDLALIKRGQSPSNKSCGHMHVDCPPGHRLAGLPACDAEPWGAYSIEFLFLQAVANSCANCDAQTKMVALQYAQETASRVSVFNQMISGSLGRPDMSSQN